MVIGPVNGTILKSTDDLQAFMMNILESFTEYSIIGTDLQGTILLWNEGARRIYGYEAAEVVGIANSSILYTPEDVAAGKPEQILRAALQLGKGEGTLNHVRKNSQRFSARLVTTPRYGITGQPTGFLLISKDISEEMHLTEELQAAQFDTRSLIESNIDALMTTDSLGVITDVTRQMAEITGREREELIGTPFKDYFTDPRRAEDGILEVLTEGRITNYELTIRARDGRRTMVSYNATTFGDAQGRLKGVLAAARDVTNQKGLEEQIRQQNTELLETTAFLNNVLESSTEYSIIAMDLTGTILVWNEGARQNYGYTAEEMIGQRQVQILHTPEDIAAGRVRDLLETVYRTGKVEAIFERVRKNGGRFTASVVMTLRRGVGGAPAGYVLISKDITEKVLEEQLQRQNKELEERYRRMEEANRLKSEFLANMSHELRTPLNAIIGFGQILHRETAGPVSEEQKEYLGDILTSSRHLLRIINDILDLSKVESGKMDFQPELVDVAQLVEEVRDILRTMAAAKILRIEVAVDPIVGTVVADAARLKQVLYNYLSNAIKFTPEGGMITVRFLPEGAEYVRLEVQDTGIGVHPEDLNRLFMEFQQLDGSSSKEYQGTGLGLALTKTIVEAQGGTVGVSSTPEQGSTFWAVLPRAGPVGPPDPLSGELLPPHPGAAGILVVEDNAIDRRWLMETLAAAGYPVQIAETGAEAVRLCAEQSFAAITLDMLLPDMAGWQVQESLRTGGLNTATPVIVVSVIPERENAVAIPIHSFLTKPFVAERLITMLREVGASPAQGHTVLVVDDDPHMLKLMEVILAERGYTVIGRSSPAEALATMPGRPDAVVLDLLMPEMDGLQFLRRFRATPQGRDVPVIMWTNADLTASDRQKMQQAAQLVVLKSKGGTDALLAALSAYVPPPLPAGPTAPVTVPAQGQQAAS